MELTQLLMDNLEIDKTQARGGVGAIFNVAQSQLDPGDFGQIAGLVPGLDGMMNEAPSSGGGMAGALGSIGKLAGIGGGGKAGQMMAMASLAGSFSKLDMDSSMLQKFAPLVLDYLKGQGGDMVGDILQGVLKK